MPTAESFPPGTPVWVDLQSSDQPAAVAFYRAFFGWEAPDASAETGGYSVATRGGVPVTAIGPLPSGVERSIWTTYFAVADADASADAAIAAGGAVLLSPGELVPGVRLAIVADPAGAVFGLWQKEQDSPWLRDEPGAVDWLELVEHGAEGSFAFYEAVLGVGVSEMHVGGAPYGLFDVGTTSVAGAMEAPEGTPAHWLVYFNVADLDEGVDELVSLGGAVVEPPVSAPGVGRWAVVADPQGGAFALLEPEREPG
ncbi:VOC family protein [Leifsonia sp. NPDC058194]|uniref:VOC family protein n=1 Tax=Leifsonia sp. NPDC058194 TaxID=3346374 RepID=UPI0036DA5165